MNKLETLYAEYLAELQRVGRIARFDYEVEKLRLAKATFFTPDFRVVLPNGVIQFHEVKARWSHGGAGFEEDARVKIKVAADLHPYVFYAVHPVKGGGWKYELIGRRVMQNHASADPKKIPPPGERTG